MRLRTIPKVSDENIREKIIKALAIFLDWEEEDTEVETGKVYRINSTFMRTRNVLRDVLVHFVRKKTSDQVLQQHFNKRLKIDNTDITVLKEIPIRILRKRKEFGFFY